MKQPLFALGQTVATPGALELLEQTNTSTQTLLTRHVTGDWGDLDEHDKAANDQAVKEGTRIFSSYKLSNQKKVWVITEADRSSTCILLPEEY